MEFLKNSRFAYWIFAFLLALNFTGCLSPVLTERQRIGVWDYQTQFDEYVRKWLGYRIATILEEELNVDFRNRLGGGNLNRKTFYQNLSVLINTAPSELEIEVDQVSNQMTVSLRNTSNFKISDTFYFKFDSEDVFMRVSATRLILEGPEAKRGIPKG